MTDPNAETVHLVATGESTVLPMQDEKDPPSDTALIKKADVVKNILRSVMESCRRIREKSTEIRRHG